MSDELPYCNFWCYSLEQSNCERDIEGANQRLLELTRQLEIIEAQILGVGKYIDDRQLRLIEVKSIVRGEKPREDGLNQADIDQYQALYWAQERKKYS